MNKFFAAQCMVAAVCAAEQIAVLWVPSANYSASSYDNIVDEFKSQAYLQGIDAVVEILNISYSTVDSSEMPGAVQDAMDEARLDGFTGDNWFLAAHGLGGVLSQDYLLSGDANVSAFKGQALMSSSLLREYRSIQEDGKTGFQSSVPTLTVGGTKDGLTRITRQAESFWHQETNVQDSQKGLFPLAIFEGLNSTSFVSGSNPKAIKNHDLLAEVDEASAHEQVASTIAAYFSRVVAGVSTSTSKATEKILAPLVAGMVLETSSVMKPSCDEDPQVNPKEETCYTGSIWNQDFIINTLIGEFPNPLITMVNDDNFHQASEVFPFHHPDVISTCDPETTVPCQLQHQSITQNYYNDLNERVLKGTEIAAVDVKTKLKSREHAWLQAGFEADFETLDHTYDRCAMVNQLALDWALENSSEEALARYNAKGQKLVMGTDVEAINGGSWIIQNLKYKDSGDTTTLVSYELTTADNFPIPDTNGMHYCKVLSPFRAIEWIYVDSLSKFDSLASNNEAEELFLQ